MVWSRRKRVSLDLVDHLGSAVPESVELSNRQASAADSRRRSSPLLCLFAPQETAHLSRLFYADLNLAAGFAIPTTSFISIPYPRTSTATPTKLSSSSNRNRPLPAPPSAIFSPFSSPPPFSLIAPLLPLVNHGQEPIQAHSRTAGRPTEEWVWLAVTP